MTAHTATLPTVVLTDAIQPEAHARLAESARILLLEDGLDKAAAEHRLRTLVREAQGLIVRRQLPADLFDHPNALRGVVRHGAGLDFIPVASATAKGLPVANTPEVNADSVAEYAIGALLDRMRRFRHFDQKVREQQWGARKSAGYQTFELRGRTLGIVGFGAIGRRIADIARLGFGMHVMAHTRSPASLPATVRHASLTALFGQCDCIVLACPLTPQTRGMIDSTVLSQAKHGLILVNVSRGAILDESALAQALDNGQVAGAVLDVASVQPLPAAHLLLAYPDQITFTPHIAGMTQDAERAMGLLAVDTQLALIRGERPFNVVNPECYNKEENQ